MLQKLAGWSPVKQIGPRAGLRSAVQFDAQVNCASVASAGSQKAADSHGSEVQSPAFSRSKSTVRSSLASRRMSFFCSTGLNEQERIERDEARKRSAELVSTALVERAKKTKHPRTLRRFGCNLLISMQYHAMVNGAPSVQARLVVMEDSIKWTKFHEFVATSLGLAHDVAKTMTFQYFDEDGRGVLITDRWALQGWLDSMWMVHPPKLHVYETKELVLGAEDRQAFIKQIFDQYDTDGSGTMSGSEIKHMLMQLDLEVMLNVPKDDVVRFVEEELRRADVNQDGTVTFDEFIAYYNSMQTFLKQKLGSESLYVHVVNKFREEYIEGKSAKRSLQQIVRNDDGLLAVESTSGRWLGIQAKFGEECLSEENKGVCVMLQTLLIDKVDYFQDSTDQLGDLYTPVVCIAFDDNTVELDENFTVLMPHCFSQENLTKSDVVVVFGNFETETWEEVDSSSFDLLPANGRSNASIVVSMCEPGIICAFSRNGSTIEQRIRVYAFVPDKIIPLENEKVSIYLAPELPTELEALHQAEAEVRGLVDIGGVSEVLTVRRGQAVEVSLKTDEAVSHSALWQGEMLCMQYDFDPTQFMEKTSQEHEVPDSRKGSAKGKRQRPTADETAAPSLEVTIRIQDLRAGMLRRRNAVKEHDFAVAVNLHRFPPPSAPSDLEVVSRTNGALVCQWTKPSDWGGCALSHYDMQVREVSNKNVVGEWINVTAKAGRQSQGTYVAKVWSAEVRVRAYNIGCPTPSGWSKTLRVGALREGAAPPMGPQRSRDCLSPGSSEKKWQRVTESAAWEGGVAVVEQGDLAQIAGIRHTMNKRMKGWSEPKKQLGDLFLQVGVAGGVSGSLFGMTIEQIDKLARSQASFGSEAAYMERPLQSLACCACWIISTLAHHTERAFEWIELMHSIEGLVRMAAQANVFSEESETRGEIVEILLTLVEVHETIRQCEEDGFITRQLAYRYDKPLRNILNEDYRKNLERLRQSVATNAMNIVLHNRRKGRACRMSFGEVSAVSHDGVGRRSSLAGGERFLRQLGEMEAVPKGAASLSDMVTKTSSLCLIPSTKNELQLFDISAHRDLSKNRRRASVQLSSIARFRKQVNTEIQAHFEVAQGAAAGSTDFQNYSDAPVWADDNVDIALPVNVPRPLSLLVSIKERNAAHPESAARTLGEAKLKLSDATGLVDKLPLKDASGNQITLSFSYRVLPWLESLQTLQPQAQTAETGLLNK